MHDTATARQYVWRYKSGGEAQSMHGSISIIRLSTGPSQCMGTHRLNCGNAYKFRFCKLWVLGHKTHADPSITSGKTENTREYTFSCSEHS
jgi:hypothetical protein